MEKKFVKGEKGDDITPFDGIEKKSLTLPSCSWAEAGDASHPRRSSSAHLRDPVMIKGLYYRARRMEIAVPS